MLTAGFQGVQPARFPRLGMIALCAGLTFVPSVLGQISPEEHEKHHPGQGKGVPPAGPKSGMMGGMAGMGGKKEHGRGSNKELYPLLMDLPDLTPERREEVRNQAQERMRSGVALMSDALERLSQAAEKEDRAAMQEATSQVREGLARFESGLAAERALAEGKAPREVALQWFKQEMNLSPATEAEARSGIFGLSWFHFFVMVVLIAFATIMVWMYFHKMQRAAALLQTLAKGGPAQPTAKAGEGDQKPSGVTVP